MAEPRRSPPTAFWTLNRTAGFGVCKSNLDQRRPTRCGHSARAKRQLQTERADVGANRSSARFLVLADARGVTRIWI